MTEDRPIVKTMTGEIFLPIRLYYKIHNKSAVVTAFKKLSCMNYDPDGDRWAWLYGGEAKKLRFEKPYSSIAAHRRPIILGSFYSREDSQMYLDVGSVDRAMKGIDFFDRRIKRSVAEVGYVAIYNKITSTKAEHPGSCFDQLFADVRTDLIDQRLEEKLKTIIESMKTGRFQEIENERTFDLVEAHRTNYYEDGPRQLELSLKMRETVALARWSGETDYSMSDLIMGRALDG